VPITSSNPFTWRHYPGDIILWCVRWYLRFPISFAHMAEMALERGLLIHSSCIWRWVQIYGPELDKRCRAHLRRNNKSYRVDETYIRIKGQDRYLYRAVDSTLDLSGALIDRTTLTLPPSGQRAFALTEIMPSLANKLGTLYVQSDITSMSGLGDTLQWKRRIRVCVRADIELERDVPVTHDAQVILVVSSLESGSLIIAGSEHRRLGPGRGDPGENKIAAWPPCELLGIISERWAFPQYVPADEGPLMN
jgi:DDE domain